MVTKDKISANRWRKRIESIRGKTRVNVWNLNPDLHWAVHNEVKNFVIQSARKGFESCDTKLKNTKPTDDCYQQLIERKCVYKQILDKRTINSIQLPAVHIARQEFSDRGMNFIAFSQFSSVSPFWLSPAVCSDYQPGLRFYRFFNVIIKRKRNSTPPRGFINILQLDKSFLCLKNGT